MLSHEEEIEIREDVFEEDEADMVDLSEIRASVEAQIAPNPVGARVASLEAALSSKQAARDAHARRIAEARMKGFEGDSCGACGNFTLVRNGTCMKCNTCGSTSGCS
jgi:ribonucleoside-diphosphate reductase alpha chain